MTFFKRLFGPSRKEVWTEVAEELGVEFYYGGFFGRDEFIYEYKAWKIYLDKITKGSGKNSRNYTRLRVPFYNLSGLKFEIFEENFMGSIRKLFGNQDIELKDKAFDDRFVIKGNDEKSIQQFLCDIELMNIIFVQPGLHLFVDDGSRFFSDAYSDGINVLVFEDYGIIKDKLVLKSLFRMFEMMLDRMLKLNITEDRSPKFKMY
ncbi:MAG: hypothetical protein AAF487_00560 [Bacteroidota bacterium]